MTSASDQLAGREATAEELARVARRLAAKGFCEATSGNFSARVVSGALISRSGADKSTLEASDFIVVDDATGRPLAHGGGSASAETPLHLAIYAARRDANVVLHAHGVASTVISRRAEAAGVVVLEGWEMLKALAGVTTHDHAERVAVFANTQDMRALARGVTLRLTAEPNAHAFLIAGHGLTTWGRTMEEAVRHVEALEFLFACALQR